MKPLVILARKISVKWTIARLQEAKVQVGQCRPLALFRILDLEWREVDALLGAGEG